MCVFEDIWHANLWNGGVFCVRVEIQHAERNTQKDTDTHGVVRQTDTHTSETSSRISAKELYIYPQKCPLYICLTFLHNLQKSPPMGCWGRHTHTHKKDAFIKFRQRALYISAKETCAYLQNSPICLHKSSTMGRWGRHTHTHERRNHHLLKRVNISSKEPYSYLLKSPIYICKEPCIHLQKSTKWSAKELYDGVFRQVHTQTRETHSSISAKEPYIYL